MGERFGRHDRQLWAERCATVKRCILPETVPDLVDASAQRFAERTAVVFFEDGVALTYAALAERTCRIANGLRAIGVAKGMRVGVMLSNRVEFPLTWIALGRLGAVMVPINPFYTARELAYVLEDSGAGALVIDVACLPTFAALTDDLPALAEERIVVVGGAGGGRTRQFDDLEARGASGFTPGEPVRRDDLLNVQYTSGTTGFPKGCMLTHDYWLVLSRSALAIDREGAARLLSAQPFFYMDPQWHLLKALWQGGAVYVARRPSATRYAGWLKEFGIEWCQFPELAIKQPDAGGAPHLKQAFLPGWRPESQRVFAERFPHAIGRDIFGMTEIGAGLAVPFDAAELVGSTTCGIPAPWRRAEIIGADGRAVAPGEVGELAIAGRSILKGYWGKPEASADAIRGEWFHTGDLFRRDEDGWFHIVGRMKDMIRRSGENIAAREVESVVAKLPLVEDAAALGVPDATRGEEVKIYVQLKPGVAREDFTPEMLLDHCRRNLAPFKVPRFIAFVDAFPRTSSNKIAKHILKDAADLRRGSFDVVDGVWR
ncbi:MAG TPA: class I adenylate-forming enzyme family protein [Microvirga sp.]|jgi:acyl-CoA synthetase (AMP-forming)/AMP-acid ligase II